MRCSQQILRKFLGPSTVLYISDLKIYIHKLNKINRS